MSGIHSKRVTLHHVARRAGVSYQTVSRVIHEHPNVAYDTRERVRQAIADLDYRPNITARSLVTRRSRTLGIIAFGKNYYGPGQMVQNIERATRLHGYNLTFSSIEEASADELRKAVDSLSDRLVDGIIVILPTSGTDFDSLLASSGDIPVVQLDIRLGQSSPSVVIDQYYGSHLATQHLIDLGHTAIAEISGPLHWFGALARHESWQATLRAAGIMPGKSIAGDWSAASGYAAARHLLDERTEMSALVAGNDQMALGAIWALHEYGLRVPQDISIVGFDDIPEAAYLTPPLTTIRQDFVALGQQSVEYLIALIEGTDRPPLQRVLLPEIIIRRSTCPLGARGAAALR